MPLDWDDAVLPWRTTKNLNSSSKVHDHHDLDKNILEKESDKYLL